MIVSRPLYAPRIHLGARKTQREVQGVRLLADRASDGISVRLFWDEAATAGADIVLEYEDKGEGVAYVIHPPRERALEAFYHPNAYVTFECRRAA
jgi:hypothetical protein